MNRYLIAAALLPMLFAGGCSQFVSDFESGHRPVDDSQVMLLSDRTDALEKLGPPTMAGRAGAGTVFMYEDVRLVESQLGINLSYDWLSIFKAVVAKGDAETETLVIVFDSEGSILSRARSRERHTIGYGGSISLIIELLPIIDTGEYTDLAPQHDWGRGLIEPLPEALNSPYSVRQGTGGVERVGTPDEVGQESLGPAD